MTNRTEILHFRATPKEKKTIRENAGHAELALSEWMRQRSLDRLIPAFEDPRTRENKAKVRQAREEGKPVAVQVVPGSAASTQPAVEEPAKHRIDGELYTMTPIGDETYEQFMERRVGELLGFDVGETEASMALRDSAAKQAEAEWAER
jgi:hypothetical protein